ncbi:extracellular matrix protein 2-like isoform X2 [Hyla sarda]|nr:extracellular matrix protein 2-like isoform X2 [Hyla sarda]XP_056396732.1 extracellular matrix protein 2-like isoform X2 [Hyla sarda]XP_056396734.1 extracellular matrix protein 2-like isoform X2 [Hyla sarda]XP_056396735.1 extracellular matrix protein 2-like isoform X2 [Hyla sarda]XP_056396736.1 extracellular matrix protein 2-like isoform X2 [Hyla sarda]
MIMYNGAAWSPQRCTICVCDQGKKVCEPLDCEEDIACPAGKLQIPPGECCPICVKTEKTQVPLESAATLNQAKVTAQKHKEVKKDTKQMKVKGDTTRITSRPALELNTTRNNNTTAIKPPKPKRTTAINRQVDGAQWKSPAKKEINNKKQETNVQKKEVKLHKTKKEENGEKNSHVEGLKTPQKKRPTEEKTRNKAIKKAASPIPSTKKPKTPHKETNNKQEDIKLLPPTPTMPGVPSFIRPTLPHIPSLPSGCLLSESAIACVNTKMTYLPLMTDPGLKILYLAENEISKLPARAFAGLPNLEWLDLSKNRLDDSGLSDDVFKNLTKLKRLNLDGNHLTFLPQLPTSLQELKVNDNNILELNRHSFHGLGHLLTLEMEGNGFHDGNVSPLTFKPLKKLIYLRLNRNHFRAVPSGLPPTIQELHLENNRIEVVSEGILNKTLNLSIIVLSNNRLQEDRIAPRAWIHLMNVESLDLSHNRLVHVPSFLPRGVKQLILHHNQIELIPGYVFAHMKPGLEFLHLSHNNLRDDGVHAVSFFGLYKSLNELLLDNNYFQSIPRGILNLKSLQVLRLSHNKIRYVPLNSICDTRISEDSNLVSVHLENNHINRHLIPPTALSCIKTYHSVILRPQHDEYEEY